MVSGGAMVSGWDTSFETYSFWKLTNTQITATTTNTNIKIVFLIISYKYYFILYPRTIGDCSHLYNIHSRAHLKYLCKRHHS